MEASGKIEVYTKKEQANLRKEKAKLESSLGGIKEMKKLPDAIVVVDPKEEHNAIAEAKNLVSQYSQCWIQTVTQMMQIIQSLLTMMQIVQLN